ncbi:MAG: hypothetical protein R6X02_10910 [Enhygromyxa sp.]
MTPASLPHVTLKLLLSFAALDEPTDPAGADELVCDDGSSAYDENGDPNADCEINECVVMESLCWSERLDFCYSESGDDNGSCHLRDKACGNGVSCWGLYIACVGEWSCRDPQWWGCGRGTCVEPHRA